MYWLLLYPVLLLKKVVSGLLQRLFKYLSQYDTFRRKVIYPKVSLNLNFIFICLSHFYNVEMTKFLVECNNFILCYGLPLLTNNMDLTKYLLTAARYPLRSEHQANIGQTNSTRRGRIQ